MRDTRRTKATHIPLAVCLALAAGGAAQAAPPAGRLLASQCAQCHDLDGNGRGFEELAGESASEIYHELVEMKNRTRIESIMDRQARGYTDAQMRALAAYLASLPGGGD